jgi:hypothetical protein
MNRATPRKQLLGSLTSDGRHEGNTCHPKKVIKVLQWLSMKTTCPFPSRIILAAYRVRCKVNPFFIFLHLPYTNKLATKTTFFVDVSLKICIFQQGDPIYNTYNAGCLPSSLDTTFLFQISRHSLMKVWTAPAGIRCAHPVEKLWLEIFVAVAVAVEGGEGEGVWGPWGSNTTSYHIISLLGNNMLPKFY